VSIGVLIVDDHKIMREGLKSLLENKDGLTVAGEADNGRTAVQLAHELSPDVILMDLTMPEMNGIDATRRIAAERPGVRVLALSMHADRRYIEGPWPQAPAAFSSRTAPLTSWWGPSARWPPTAST